MRSLLTALVLLASSGARADELLVFAAVSTSDALQELGKSFTSSTGHRVSFSFGASNDLARQVLAGARPDVFLSADEAQLARLAKAGPVDPKAISALLSNQLVIATPIANSTVIEGPAALGSLKRIAVADPEGVPLGVYARAWLERIGLWEKVRPRIIPTLDARAALSTVETGDADAAILYRTDALRSKRVKVAFVVPMEQGPKILYPVAPLESARQPATRAFLEHLRSKAGRAAFERLGFALVAD